MSEHLEERSTETHPPQPERLAEAAREQLEKLDQSHERSSEHQLESNEAAEHVARHEALEAAVSVEGGAAETKAKEPSTPLAKRRGPISKRERDIAFTDTMDEARKSMSSSSRAFSKFIHAKPIEKSSEFVGSTVARPNAVLSGAVAAFLLTLAVYVVAKTFGYPLSGFESIGAFIVGWVLGITFDYLKTLVTGKR